MQFKIKFVSAHFQLNKFNLRIQIYFILFYVPCPFFQLLSLKGTCLCNKQVSVIKANNSCISVHKKYSFHLSREFIAHVVIDSLHLFQTSFYFICTRSFITFQFPLYHLVFLPLLPSFSFP